MRKDFHNGGSLNQSVTKKLIKTNFSSLSDNDFLNVFEDFQDIFFIYYNNLNEQIDLKITPSVNEILGYSLADFEHIMFLDLFSNSSDSEKFIEKIRNEKKIKNYPAIFKNKIGKKINIEIDCTLVTETLPKKTEYLLRGVIKDVTKQFKENLRKEIAYLISEKSQRKVIGIKSLAKLIHHTLNKVVDASNFYIALHDSEKNELYLPIIIDEYLDVKGEFRIAFENSITAYIITSNQVLILDKIGIKTLIQEKNILVRGEIPEYFVGIPLKSEGKCFGVMVIQTYIENNVFLKEDVELFQFLSTQIAYVIEKSKWEETLIKQEEHYRSLVENSSEIIGVINENGILEYISSSINRITGYKVSELIGKNISNFIKVDGLTFLIKDRINNPLINQLEILKIKDVNGNNKYLEISLNSYKDNKLIFNAKDITQRIFLDTKNKRTLKKVSNLEKVLNHATSVIFTDKEGVITNVNKKTLDFNGYSKKELIGKPISLLSSNYFSQNKWKLFWKRISSGKIWEGELRNKKKDGSLYWIYSTVIPILNSKKEVESYLTIRFDITKEKLAKRNTVLKVIKAQEYERQRFSMEIHDGLGQVLLAAKMNLNALSDSSEGLSIESKDILNNSIKLLTEGVNEARNISHGLTNHVLAKYGLVYALNQIVNNIGTTSSLMFKFNHNIDGLRFDEEIELNLYRAIQEIIKNIIKHSKATTAHLKITKKDNKMEIIVKDNGIGIKQGEINSSSNGGIGLKNIRSRVEYIGGAFEIDSKIIKGTKIKLKISL